MARQTLSSAKKAKNDEFYTLMEDIENEISQYDFSHFKDKIIYCNCDDPTWSSFFKFFVKWGEKMGIKEAVFTNFSNAQRQFKQFTLFEENDFLESAEDDKKGTAHYWVYTPETDKTEKKKLKGSGDFRSAECTEFLEKADIVVTNPPFSLFREYVEQLVKYNKNFLIIGNPNAIHYKEIFKLIQEDKIWLGFKQLGKDTYFKIPAEHQHRLMRENKEGSGYVIKNGEVLGRTMACWFTNIDIIKRHKPLVLHQQDLSQFCRYDNYDAIDIPQVKLIPDNYYGAMGVPDAFIQQYNPEQFEIIGIPFGDLGKEIGVTKNYRGRTDISLTKNGKSSCPYSRIIIKRKGEL